MAKTADVFVTEEEQNFIKDLLKVIGKDDGLTTQLAQMTQFPTADFNRIADSVWTKMQNGRVSVTHE